MDVQYFDPLDPLLEPQFSSHVYPNNFNKWESLWNGLNSPHTYATSISIIETSATSSQITNIVKAG